MIWERWGECDRDNSDWMRSNCYRSCSLCEGITVTQAVWFEVAIDDEVIGRFTIGLFGDILPITTFNVMHLANFTYGFGYTGTIFHRIIDGFVVQGGDITKNNGYGGRSIYGGEFDDESFLIRHYGKGWVNLANKGEDTNESQFAVLTTAADWLDERHIVIGKILNGYNVIRRLETTETQDETPVKECKIVNAGITPITGRKEVEKKDVIGN